MVVTFGWNLLSGGQLEKTKCEGSKKFRLKISGAKYQVPVVGQFVQYIQNDNLKQTDNCRISVTMINRNQIFAAKKTQYGLACFQKVLSLEKFTVQNKKPILIFQLLRVFYFLLNFLNYL